MKSASFIILFFVIVFFRSYAQANMYTFSDVESFLCEEEPDTPILTYSDAICFATSVHNVTDLVRKAQIAAEYEAWKVSVHKDKASSKWKLTIRSTGKKLPRYHCTVSFIEKGGVVKPDSLLSRCGYNK